MRESMLHDLYFGNFSPWERDRIRTREYGTVIKKIDNIVEHFKNLLSPEEYEKFTEMQNLQAQAASIEEEEFFKYAFCAGTRLMIDVFTYTGK